MRLYVLLLLLSYLATAGLRNFLARFGVIDRPNGRSSHTVPVPRGGGAAIVLVFLLAIVWRLLNMTVPCMLAWALLGGGTLIALTGFVDDCCALSPWPKLLIHILAAAWACWCFHGMAPPHFAAFIATSTWIGCIATVTGLVWITNLFNFMDGIDGLAGTEAVCVAGLGAFVADRGGSQEVAPIAWMLSAASLGFLIWNWPPARIFMGDTGSGFLGYALGVLALFSCKASPANIWSWMILLAAFLADSSVTLFRRMIVGERWYEAHRNHAYQHAARMWSSHKKVTLAVAALDLGGLFPLAYAVQQYPKWAPAIAAAAFAPLVILALRFKAGLPTELLK